MEHVFELIPQDVLFFRDARPMEASDAGCGANWPRPDQLYHALMSALLSAWPRRQDWEGTRGNMRFGALRTVGPFPKRRGGEVYLPCPLDWNMCPVKVENTDLPSPLTHAFLPPTDEKISLPRWLPTSVFAEYLKGKCVDLSKRMDVDDAKLFSADRQIGIALDPRTNTTMEGHFYQAEYLRLQEDVTMAFGASCRQSPSDGGVAVDVLARADAPSVFALGGQRRMCRISASAPLAFPSVPIHTRYLRWTLITPAVFLNGWCPGWVDATDEGRVKLRRVCEARRPGESRAEWKARCNGASVIEARLVAARIGKPEAFSGWRLAAGVDAPKPTVLAVPAGSCYVFDCGGVEEAKALADVLQIPHPHSDLYGEQGYGLGLCSSVNL